MAAHAEAVRFYRAELVGTAEARAYLTGRGLPTVAGEERWALGYSPPRWVGLVSHLRDRHYRDREIEQAGLAVRSRTGRLVDRFRDRLMFPLRDATGSVVGFTGRDISGSSRAPKYLNSPSSAIFRKSTVLFGLAEQLADLTDPQTRCMVVEGPVDVLAVAEAMSGYTPPAVVAVATCGTALTAGHVELVAGGVGRSRPLAIAFDPDPAGRAGADRAYRLLRRWPAPVEALTLPADPAAMLRDHGPRALRSAVTAAGVPLLDTAIEHRLAQFEAGLDGGWAETRVAALRSVAPLIADEQQPAQFTRRVASLALRLDLDPLTVSTAVLDLVATDEPPAPGRRKLDWRS